MSNFEEAWVYARQIPGWYTECEAELLWKYAVSQRVAVEVGCFCGRSTNVIAAAVESFVYAIDIFDGEKHRETWYQQQLELAGEEGNFFESFKRWTLHGPWGHKVIAVVAKDTNWKWKWLNGTIGFLHLDHEHTADAVERSLRHWHRWMLPDGVVAIHDYFGGKDPNVKKGAERVKMQVIDSVRTLAICQYGDSYE